MAEPVKYRPDWPTHTCDDWLVPHPISMGRCLHAVPIDLIEPVGVAEAVQKVRRLLAADHIPACTGLGAAAADAGEAAAKVHAVDVEAFELAKHACQLLLRAHQRAHRHCPTADTHWPTGQPKPRRHDSDA